MSNSSPEAVLYDIDGSPLAVDNGAVIPSDTPTLIGGGSDGTNAHYIIVDSTGRQVLVGAGTAGTPIGGVITIQGTVGGTAVPTSVSGTVTISGTVTANIGTTGGLALDTTLAKLTISQGTALGTNTQALMGGSVTTASPTYTTGNINPLSLTTAGALRIDGSNTTQPVSGTVTANAGTGTFNVAGTVTANAGTGNFNNASIGTTGSAVPSSISAAGFSDGTNSQIARVFDVDSGAGAQYVQGVNLRLSASGGSVEFGTNTNPIRIDPTGTTTQPVSGTVTANAGTGNFTVVQATPSNLLANVGGLGASGAAVSGNPVRIGGSDGTNTRDILVDASGRQIVIGAAANGAAVVGNPILIAGSDGANARSIRTASDGTVRVDPTGTTTQPVSGTVTANIGTTNGLALDATLAKLTISQGTALGTNTQALVGGSVTTAAPTYTTGQISPLSLTTAGAVRIDGSGTTQPISGTVTSNQGTANTLANRWPVIVTDGTNTMPTADVAARAQFDKITDGTNTAAVKAASTAAIATDPALVVAVSPNNTVAVNQTQINGSAVTTIAAGEQKVATEGLAANGAAASGNPVLMGGKDDANVARTVRTDPAGDMRVVIQNVPSNATFGNPFGQASSGTPSGKFFPLRATVYTEQTTNAQRSVKSTSTNDTNTAGTGARQVVITYLDQTGAGPFTETVNLNGTTAVNTVSTTICFIEEIHVISVGSTGSNQGTISLFTTTGGGGSAFASIGVGNIASNGTVGDNQTIWAHHYTPTGKTTTISATAFGTDGNRTGNGLLRTQNPTVATSPEVQITGNIVLDASSPTTSRTYYVPVQVVGPARTTFYGVSAGTNTFFYGVFEYWDI